MTLSNKVTLSRLILGPLLVMALFISLSLTLAIVIVHIITDILDGYLARKRGEITEFGSQLDLLVDIIFICLAAIGLSIRYSFFNFLPWFIILYIIFIPLGLWIAALAILYKRHKKFIVVHSRFKSLTMSIIAIVGLVLVLSFHWPVNQILLKSLIYLALLVASLDSLEIFWRVIKQKTTT